MSEVYDLRTDKTKDYCLVEVEHISDIAIGVALKDYGNIGQDLFFKAQVEAEIMCAKLAEFSTEYSMETDIFEQQEDDEI